MSAPKTPAERRARRAALAMGVSGAAGLAAALIVGVDWRARAQAEGLGPLAPGFAAARGRAARIMVTSAAGVLTLTPAPYLPAGAAFWRLAERGGYPVSEPKRLAALTALAGAQTRRLLTRDATRFAALSLGDPGEGGAGVRIHISDARGVSLLDLILGAEISGGAYARRAREGVALAASGVPLGLERAESWLELRPPGLARADIMAVEVSLAGATPYRLVRGEAGFGLAPPFDQRPVVAPVGISATAHALTAVAPMDVAPRGTLAGASAAGRVVVETRAGVRWAVGVLRGKAGQGEAQVWMTIDASPALPAAEPAAQALQAQLGPWAYQITDLDGRALLAPLDTLIRL